jgi:hypothetical protein
MGYDVFVSKIFKKNTLMGNIIKTEAYKYVKTIRKKISITHLTNYTGIRYVLLKSMIGKIKNLHVP